MHPPNQHLSLPPGRCLPHACTKLVGVGLPHRSDTTTKPTKEFATTDPTKESAATPKVSATTILHAIGAIIFL
jgi:hypothetical protein